MMPNLERGDIFDCISLLGFAVFPGWGATKLAYQQLLASDMPAMKRKVIIVCYVLLLIGCNMMDMNHDSLNPKIA